MPYRNSGDFGALGIHNNHTIQGTIQHGLLGTGLPCTRCVYLTQDSSRIAIARVKEEADTRIIVKRVGAL